MCVQVMTFRPVQNPLVSTMQLLDLPPEILHEILLQSIISRGLPRALRLKLVCRMYQAPCHRRQWPTRFFASMCLLNMHIGTFLEAFTLALFESGILDDRFIDEHLGATYAGGMDARRSLYCSYVTYRVLRAREPCLAAESLVDRMVLQMRRVARGICREVPAVDYNTVVAQLCQVHSFDLADKHDEDQNLNMDLLCAASYLNLTPLVTRLMDANGPLSGLYHRRSLPSRYTELFHSPLKLAALAGNIDMLRLLRSAIPNPKEKSRISTGAVMGAVRRGDVELLRVALQLFPGDSAASPDQILYVNRSAPNWAVMAHLMPLAKPRDYECGHETFMIDSLVCRSAGRGRLDIVRGMVTKMDGNPSGVSSAGFSRSDDDTLVHAARGSTVEMVDLLFDLGADHRGRGNSRINKAQFCARPLLAAAEGGNLPTLRRLLARGVPLHTFACFPEGVEGHRCPPAPGCTSYHAWNAYCWKPLQAAIHLEHTAMVHFLLEQDAGDPPVWEWLCKEAEDKGLESMADLLHHHLQSSFRGPSEVPRPDFEPVIYDWDV